MSITSDALEQLRQYLRAWRAWMRAWRAPLGIPSAVPWLKVMPPTPAWSSEENDGSTDHFIMSALSAEVESLPVSKRFIVRFVYLQEELPNELRYRFTPYELRQLCSEAERDMVPNLRRRGVVLGGV